MNSCLQVDLKLGTYQCANIRRDISAALRILTDVVAEAAAAGLDLVLFPELYLCGYDISVPDLKQFAVTCDSDEILCIRNLAADRCIAIGVGYAEKSDLEVYNSCCLIDARGHMVLNYRKTHLFDPVGNYEKAAFTPGFDLPVADIYIPRTKSNVTVGILICFDCEFPEPSRSLTLKGASVILIPTALAAGAVDDITPRIVVPSRAADNHVFIVYSNFCGSCLIEAAEEGNSDCYFCGQSGIIGPDGRDIVRADESSTRLYHAHVLGEGYAAHIRRNDYLAERKPSLYSVAQEKDNAPLIATLDAIRAAVPSVAELLQSAADGYKALSAGQAHIAPVQHLKFDKGDTCVKSGYRITDRMSQVPMNSEDDQYFVTKIASGHPANVDLGTTATSGVMMIFSQLTGKLKAILLDDGYLTDLRTAVAGALAIQQFGPECVTRIGVVGTGTQARFQLKVLRSVTLCRHVVICGRDELKLAAIKRDVEQMGYTSVETTSNVSDVCSTCNVIITATTATTPLITAEQIQPGTMIVAVGADCAGKQELDSQIFHPNTMDLVLVDSKAQCCSYGETSHAIRCAVISASQCVEIGSALTSMSEGEFTGNPVVPLRAGDVCPADGHLCSVVFDSTGVAIQDVQIAEAVYRALKKGPI